MKMWKTNFALTIAYIYAQSISSTNNKDVSIRDTRASWKKSILTFENVMVHIHHHHHRFCCLPYHRSIITTIYLLHEAK